MITYCLSCKKDTKNIDRKVVKTKNNRLMMLSKCSVCNNKKFRFKRIIKQFRNSNTVKSNSFVKCIILIYKMNKILNKFLLTGDKCMPEMHLRQPGFTYSACGPFTKHKERIKKI